jgi:predicted Zn finger-like uncharacterized protein
MNYITACPACGTQFLLNNAHLKAHRGKVQCGNCEHIFNAKNRLTEVSDDIHSPEEYNASLEESSSEPDETQVLDEKRIGEALNIVLEAVPDLQDLESDPSDLDYSAEFPIKVAQDDDSPFISTNTPEFAESYDTNLIGAPITIEDLTSNSKFVKTKTKLNYWLVSLGVLLAILAGLQTIYAKRTQIAAEYPQYKPYLVQACNALKCEIPLPTNLDLLTIDDSDMQEDENHQNVIKFSSLLINNAHFTQAYPNIELTLTSTDDQPVLRRLIKPAEYLKTADNVSTGLASREEIRIQLAINVKDLAVTGYRVLLVY